MKMAKKILYGIVVLFLFSGTAAALDIESLDKVNVMMTKSKVISILGKPDLLDQMKGGLNIEIYNVKNLDPMVSTGCIYENDEHLAGQAFIFHGEMSREAAARLKQLGFAVTEEKAGAYRLLGKDDDTGQPLVVYIFSEKGLTVVMTFEREFYERRVK